MFRTLVEFYKAAEAAVLTDECIVDFHRDTSPSFPDQELLRDAIVDLLNSGHEELVPLFVQGDDLGDNDLVGRLIDHEEGIYRECVAQRMISQPNPNLLKYAERCAADHHPNVWRPGLRALAAIRAILPERRTG